MKIIKIPNCKECIYSYEKDKMGKGFPVVCADVRIFGIKPSIQDRTITTEEIPNWCILEDDNGNKQRKI